MKFADAVSFPFRGPNAWPNIGFLFVCFLIPIVGPMVAAGFQCTTEKMLVANIDAEVPRFDFGKFTFYLQRGVMPFVVSLLASLVFIPVFIVLFLGGLMAVVLLAENHPVVMVLLLMGAGIFILVLSLLLSVVLTPLVFRAGVQGVIMPAFEKAFLLEFMRLVGGRTLLLNLQIMLATLPLMLVACIPFVVYAALGVLILVQTHARAQLYLEYLARGGTPLAIVPDPLEPAFPVMIAPPTGDGQ